MVLLLIPSLYSGGGGEEGIQITAHLQLFVVVERSVGLMCWFKLILQMLVL